MSVVTQPRPAGWAASLVSLWIRVYTVGLSPDLKLDRRTELASDLWEHANDARSDGPGLNAEIVARSLLGIPADLAWRIERSRLARAPGGFVSMLLAVLTRGESVGRWIGRRGLPGFATAAATLAGLIGVLVIVTAPTNNSGTPTANLVWWGSVILVAAIAVGAGSRLIERRPRLGGGLIILGSAVLGLFLWPTIVAPITALVLGWRAVLRMRQPRTVIGHSTEC